MSDRHFKALAPIPWHLKVPRRDTAPGAANLKVAFFVGCLIDKLYPQVADAVLQVLDHHGVGVHLPAGQGCCGIPALSGGDTQTFRQLVRLNLELLDDPAAPCDFLVTACATCSSTIKKLWPLMMADAEPAVQERVAALAAKTLDISQFLVDKAGGGARGHWPGGRPDSPDLSRSLPSEKIAGGGGPAPGPACRQPRLYPQGDARVRLVLRLRRQLQLSSTTRPRRPSADASGTTSPPRSCRVVATGCPACMLQITDMLSQAGLRVQVKHAVEIYAESLKK